MKKFLSVNYSSGALNFSLLLIRLVFGIFMIANHGLPKLMEFSEKQYTFHNFLGIGSRFSLILAIFAELFCSMFIVLGLFTRIAVIPLIITMCVAVFSVNAGKPLFSSELALLYLCVYTGILFVGPGRISVDGMMRG